MVARKDFFSAFIAFFIKLIELFYILFDAADLDRVLWADDKDAAFFFHSVNEVELLVVDSAAVAEDSAETGVTLVDESGDLQVFLTLAE